MKRASLTNPSYVHYYGSRRHAARSLSGKPAQRHHLTVTAWGSYSHSSARNRAIRRFLAPKLDLTARELGRLTSINHVQHEAVAALFAGQGAAFGFGNRL